MEKRYSIKNAFTTTLATLISYKKEFLKLIVLELLMQLPSLYSSVTPTVGVAFKAFSLGVDFLSFVLMVTGSRMFLQAFKGEQVSFIGALNKVATAKIIRNFLLLCLMFLGALIAFVVPLILVVALINTYVAMPYAYIIDGIIIVACAISAFCYVGYYSIFAFPALADGNSALESLKKNYELVSLRLMLIVLGSILLYGGLIGLIAGALVVINLSMELIIIQYIVPLIGVLVESISIGVFTNLYLQLKK